MGRERGNGPLPPRVLLLLVAMLRDARAQDYCVDHYWVPGTGARGTAEESCHSMQPKDGWCGESASNCEGGCAGVWCTAASTGTSSDTAGTSSDTTAPCVDVDNGLMGRFSYTCASIGDNLDKCTGYDANGFVAGDMCCQCGGGALQVHVLPSHALRFGQGDSEYELQLTSLGADAVAGVWTLSAWAMYTPDFDGCKKLLHSRWWSGTTILGTTGSGCDGQIGWPSTAGTWERVSETFDTEGVVPSSMVWFVGYSQSNTAGNSYVTDLQITGPDGSTWINDGTFDGGSHMSLWNPTASYGTFSVVSTPQRSCPSCIVCPAGRYSGVVGGTGCSLCPAGSVTNTFDQPGATTCALCPPGRYSQSPQLACRDCSAGSFTDTLDEPGATNCSVCLAGQYSPSPHESCQQCPIGQYNDAPNRTNCTLCRAGVTDTHDRPGATRCDMPGRTCAGKVQCEWVEGPARFLCAFGSSLVHKGYRVVLPWEFDLVGDAHNDGNTTLVLTTTQGDQMGLARYRLATPPQWLTDVFTVRFEMYVGDGNGADGMCVNLGDQSPASTAEDGVATGVSLCFDEHPNSDFENGVDLYVDGVVVWEERAECSHGDCHPMTLFEDARWHSVELTVSPDATGGMTVAFEFDDGTLNGTAHVDDFDLPPGQESWLMFSARTGGLTNNHWVRNVAIREGGATPSDVPEEATAEGGYNLTLRSFASPTCSVASGGPAGSTGGDMYPPKLGVAFSSDFLCGLPASSPASSRKIVHAPPDLRAVARVVKREHLEGLDGLPDAIAAKRIGLSLQCYERVLAAMNNSATKEEVPLVTLQEFEYVGCGEEQPATQDTETCISADYMPDGPESAYWAAILSNQTCLPMPMCNMSATSQDQCRMIAGRDAVGCADLEGTDWMPDPCINAEREVCNSYGVGTDNAPCCEWTTAPCAQALERLRAKFAGCAGVWPQSGQ